MFAIMPNKKGDSYVKVFNMIKEAFTVLNLDTEWRSHAFMMDFEAGMRNGLKTVFPLVNLLGCYFHFAQVNVYDNIDTNIKYLFKLPSLSMY